MSASLNILSVGALSCVAMLLVLGSLSRSEIPGIREWCSANVLAAAALALQTLAGELPPWLAIEAVTFSHAAGIAAAFAGFRRFTGHRMRWSAVGVALALLIAATILFHYRFDSAALRAASFGLFEGGLLLAIALALARARKPSRLRAPYLFIVALALAAALGNVMRIAAAFETEYAALPQSEVWQASLLAMDAFIVPLLGLGAVMLVHGRLLAQSEHAANRDFLTGAWSRSAFFESVEQELSRARRTGRALSLLLIDIDHFKQINDDYGHAGGEQVLMDVVLRAEGALRNADVFARIGGEEFGVLLPETDRYAAHAAAERLRVALDTKPPAGKARGATTAVPYTVSIGVATLRGADSQIDLLRRADAALYTAKAIGRNRVVSEAD
ncbi:MAG TPA: GGDEF domain-containing protein [Noviherbaspirillum sp.]|uniref:GGDEF domain-containing protein n=1 Tax=Noviherbaspirillum sp. TaxID=1926288 RepID=UPI002B4A19D7|nr:GGDEF domain-containing protein [Noviherbaspirillum sp.]HJV83923.1 GGDEF domain-containing protein [Noviherbaspirillum sp.]